MGVYVFRSLHGDWFKVGHHQVTERRPNVYYRCVGRGFASCQHPSDLEGHLTLQDFELVAWYPELGLPEEKTIHAHRFPSSGFDDRVGEFYKANLLEDVLQMLDGMGQRREVDETDKQKAVAWASKRQKKRPRS